MDSEQAVCFLKGPKLVIFGDRNLPDPHEELASLVAAPPPTEWGVMAGGGPHFRGSSGRCGGAG